MGAGQPLFRMNLGMVRWRERARRSDSETRHAASLQWEIRGDAACLRYDIERFCGVFGG